VFTWSDPLTTAWGGVPVWHSHDGGVSCECLYVVVVGGSRKDGSTRPGCARGGPVGTRRHSRHRRRWAFGLARSSPGTCRRRLRGRRAGQASLDGIHDTDDDAPSSMARSRSPPATTKHARTRRRHRDLKAHVLPAHARRLPRPMLGTPQGAAAGRVGSSPSSIPSGTVGDAAARPTTAAREARLHPLTKVGFVRWVGDVQMGYSMRDWTG